jgi:acetyl-CoA C-acetyltransferase
MRQEVAIIGVGQSAFVRGYEGSIRELAFEGYREAMEDANLTSKDIDASIIASAPEYDRQRSPAGVIAEYIGLIPQPTCYIETVCSSSSTGVLTAY